MVHQWAPAAYRPTAGHINEQAAKSVPRPISRCCEIRNGPLSASKGTIVVTGAVTHRGKTGRCSRAKRTTGDQNGRFPGAAPIRRHSRPFAFAVSLRARPGETVKPGTASTRLHLGPARTTLQPKKTVRLRTCAFRIACRTSVFKAASMALAALDRPELSPAFRRGLRRFRQARPPRRRQLIPLSGAVRPVSHYQTGILCQSQNHHSRHNRPVSLSGAGPLMSMVRFDGAQWSILVWNH